MNRRQQDRAFQKFIEQAAKHRDAYDGMVPMALVWAPMCTDPTHDHGDAGTGAEVDMSGPPGVMWVPGPDPDTMADLLAHAAHGIRWREGHQDPDAGAPPTPEDADIRKKIGALLSRFAQAVTGDVSVERAVVRTVEAIMAAVVDDRMGVPAVPPDPGEPRAPLEIAERLAQQIGRNIATACPPGWGFILTLASFGENSQASYISNVAREDVISTLRKVADRVDGER